MKYDPTAEPGRRPDRRVNRAMNRRAHPDVAISILDILGWTPDELYHHLRQLQEYQQDTDSKKTPERTA